MIRIRDAARLARLPPTERTCVLHALVAACAVEIGLRTVRFNALARALGVDTVEERSPPGSVSLATPDLLRRVAAVDRVLSRWPRRGRCLRRALVLGHMLRAHRPRIRIGVANGRDGVSAHAWIEVAGVRLAEPESRNDTFTPLSRP